MENQIKVFENAEFGNVRTVVENDVVLFCGSDVAKCLGYSRPNDAVAAHCRSTTKYSIPHPQSKDKSIEMAFIMEGDVYRLITHSKLPSAEKFERWVFDDVLPAIRKTVSALETIEYKGNVDGLVYAKDGIATTTSVNIAKVFEREHKNILQIIDSKVSESTFYGNLAAENLAAKLNDSVAQFCADHVKESVYIDSRGKAQRQYELDEYGFSFIVLSLTGEKADVFKTRYINAFIEMRKALQNMFKARLVESVLPQDNRNRQYIYILKNPLNETIKIGVAQDVEKRIQQLQTGAGVELELVYKSLVCSNAFSVERDVHAHFDNKRTFGEWFKVSVNEAVEFLEKQTFVLKSEFAKYIGVGVK